MEKEVFFPDDRPILVYEARRPSVTRFDDPDGVPAEPINVEVRIYDVTSGSMVDIDGLTVTMFGQGYIDMVPMDEPNGRGALIYLTIPPAVSQNPGDYTLYILTEYLDGLRITADQKLQISEYR